MDQDTRDAPANIASQLFSTQFSRQTQSVCWSWQAIYPHSLRKEKLLAPASVIQRCCYSNYPEIITNHLILLQEESDFLKASASSQGENCILWEIARTIFRRARAHLIFAQIQIKTGIDYLNII